MEGLYTMTTQLSINELSKARPELTTDEMISHIDAGDMLGMCTQCGSVADGVEPDAREYRCNVCGLSAVFGLEQYLLEFV